MDDFDIVFAVGPSVKKVSRTEALDAIQRNPQFPKGAKVTVDELEGHWVAAVGVPKEAGEPPFKGGGPADAEDGGPGPKSEGPDDTEPSEGEEETEPTEDKPPFGEKKDKGESEHHEKGEDHLLNVIHDSLQKIMIALGIPDSEGPEASPIPGAEHAPPPPPGPAGGPDETIEHTKALKPGETPPGGTPVGAPAFSHVHENYRDRIANHPITKQFGHHPWENIVGRKSTFTLSERIPDKMSAEAIDHELQQVAYGTGYKIKQIQPGHNDQGQRIARVLVSDR